MTGINDVTAWFNVSAVETTFCVAETEALTVRLNDALDVAPFVSVTVTLYVVAVDAIVGVPLTAPLEEEKVRPTGKAGEML